MVITAVMVHRQRAVVRAFEQAGATSATEARSAEQLGLRQGMAWHRLVAQTVLRCPGEARYFVDVANWQRLQQRRRRLALAIVAIMLAVLAGIVLLSRGAP